MLTEICAEIKNYFTFAGDKHIGDFKIVGGYISPSFNISTDYIRIIGSHKNDGVHVRKDGGFILEDEDEFHGAIWVMSPPKDFIMLAEEIADWQAKYGSVGSQAMSPFNSESFGGYSYSKSSGSSSESGGNGSAGTWQNAYATRLNAYRRIRVL